jgi:hypothetical protein
MFKRGPSEEILTNEHSGHYWKNWTPEVRFNFEESMKQYGINVKHNPGI